MRLRFILNEEAMNVSLRQITNEMDFSMGDISHLCSLELQKKKMAADVAACINSII